MLIIHATIPLPAIIPSYPVERDAVIRWTGTEQNSAPKRRAFDSITGETMMGPGMAKREEMSPVEHMFCTAAADIRGKRKSEAAAASTRVGAGTIHYKAVVIALAINRGEINLVVKLPETLQLRLFMGVPTKKGISASTTSDTFVPTSVPSDPSFQTLQDASFIVFDKARGLEILGSSPRLEKVFDTRNDSIHEAPVYVPGLNVIIFSLARQGIYEQRLITLNISPPTIENYTTSPPVYAVNGGKWYKDRIYWASEASFSFPSPTNANLTVRQAPGIYMLNPYNNETSPLVNNVFGTLLNSPNDLFIDSTGDIFFTDSWYGYAINVTSTPRLPPQTYRFRPSTGSLNVVENSMHQPNGIGISPDGRTMYISDTGADAVDLSLLEDIVPRFAINPFGGSALYAFDVESSPAENYITSKRPISIGVPFAADGFHVSRERDLLGVSGTGVDVLSAFGEMVLRIEVGGEVNQCQFVGQEREELWIFGPAGIFRVSGLKGIHGMVDE